MSSYFDHFILIKLGFISDCLLLMFVMFFLVFAGSYFHGAMFFTTQLELIAFHWKEVLIENNLPEKFSFNITCLFFILASFNSMGFLLYIFPITTHFFFTLNLSFSIYLYFLFAGLNKFKFDYFSNFFPGGAPLLLSPLLVFIEFVSNLCRPVALGLRIAANLSAGHVLFSVLTDFGIKLLLNTFMLSSFTIFIIMFMVLLELGVIIIQAYVFCLLLVIYSKDVIELH